MNAPTTLAAIIATADFAGKYCTDITKAQYDAVMASAAGDQLPVVEGGVDIAVKGEWYHVHTMTLTRSRQQGGETTRYILTQM